MRIGASRTARTSARSSWCRDDEANVHAVITGASSGIGAALARELHGAGARVTLVARRGARLSVLADALGADRCRIVVCDLADSPTEWIEEAERYAPIDVFVNNAGIQAAGPFACSDDAIGRRLLAVDLLAPVALARAVVPRMLARRSGIVVNVSSLAALVPPAGMARYVAAKAGLAAFSEALRAELAGTGVHVLTVYPGPIDNGAPQETYDVYGRSSVAARLPVGRADALARAIHRAIDRRRARLIFPRIYGVAWWALPIARWLVARATPPIRWQSNSRSLGFDPAPAEPATGPPFLPRLGHSRSLPCLRIMTTCRPSAKGEH
jgi:short-subunit dehydrogenase